MSKPALRHSTSFWTITDYPSKEQDWTHEKKAAAFKEAGFDSFSGYGTPENARLAKANGLIFTGYFSSGNADEFPQLLRESKDAGARHVNVQLADHDTPTEEAIRLAVVLMEAGRKLDVEPAVEVHRDTCTETPEKTYALADGYQKATGELLPMTWDFSHPSVIKHLHPGNFIERLLVRPDLVQRAQQFHFRPFNGHHCQVPVTDGRGNLTQEVKDWLPFAEAVLKCWLDGNRNTDREIFVCPEMGPVPGGYNFSTLPHSWEDAKVLRVEIAKIWERLTGG